MYTFGLNNNYSGKVHDIHKCNVKTIGSDIEPVVYSDYRIDLLKNLYMMVNTHV